LFTSSRLFRTSSFRLTLLYSGLTGASFLLMFGVVYWSTAHFMGRQIDATVASELSEIQSDAQEGGEEKLRGIVSDVTGRAPGYFYLLQDASGAVLAGNLPALQPLPGVREWPGSVKHRGNTTDGIRGCGVVLAGGGYLFVGLSTHQMHEMKEMVVRSFLVGLGLAMLLALAGGAVMSLGVVRKIETVSQTSRDIVGGDLQRRIPVRGNGDEFDHLAMSLNAMLDRIQTLMEGLRQVSTDIAHDLRTPLTRLRQRLELAQRRGLDVSSSEDLVEATLRDIDSILETFGALLRIAQIESGARKAGFAAVDLSELLHTVIEVYQPALEEKGQVLLQDVAPALRLRGDRELLTQMFANLLENAFRHCAAGARVEIAARRNGGRIEVSVADNGPGIPAEARTKVLQRFFRLEGSRTTPGNGLGLSMAAAVAGLHETQLELSDNSPGLRVRVSLPSLAA
jgi:signal transduction histidine kinase